ncbi:ribonuclease H-like domain-containing protein [Tanacetum coccineum]
MPTRFGKSSSKYIGMLQFSTSLTSLEPLCLKEKYEALILHGNDKNASDIDKQHWFSYCTTIAQLESLPSMVAENEVHQLRKLYNLGRAALYGVSDEGRFSPGSGLTPIMCAAWALRNIVSSTSENIKVVIDHGQSQYLSTFLLPRVMICESRHCHRYDPIRPIVRDILCHDINIHIPHHVSLKIPSYNLWATHKSLQGNWGKLHQLHLDEEALKETLEEQARDEKEREEKIRQKQAEDEEFMLEFSTSVEPSPLTSNLVWIIPGPAGIVQLSSSTRVEPSPSTPNPVRIIPGLAGIVQQAKLLKERDILLGWDGAIISTQEYIKKVVEDVGDDEDFKSGPWVSATDYVHATGGITLKDLSGTIPRRIHHKVIGDGGYGKDIIVGAAMILANAKEGPTNFALMAYTSSSSSRSDSEVSTCSKTCIKMYETLKTQLEDLRVEYNKSEFNLANYKRGLAFVEERLVFYKNNEVIFTDQIVVLKSDASFNEAEIIALKSYIEKLKKEKEDNLLKINNYDNATKSLDKVIGSQLVDNNKKGLGYNVVPPPPTGLFAPPIIDLSHSGIEKFKEPEFEGYGVKVDKCVSETSPKEIKKTPDAPIIEDWVSDDEEQDESKPKSEKKTVIPTVKKKEFVKAKQDDKTVRNTVKYAEMYRSQKPRGNQRNWNNLKSQQLGNEFVMNNKACFACGSFNHLIKDCKRKVQKPIWNNARRVNHHNSHRMSYPHPKRNFVPKAVLMKTGMRPVNAAKPKAAYNAVKRNRFNVVKTSACWVWMPKNRVVDHVSKYISASVTLKRLDYIDAQGRFKSVMAWMDAQAQGRQECSKEKEESREECSKSRKTKKMKCLEESSQQRK